MTDTTHQNASPEGPIGIFDSGVGGLTVARAVRKLLPNEDIIYFGDTLHLPYGEKSPDAIVRYSIEITDFLHLHRAKCVLIACNSASANAFQALADMHPGKLFINVIDPVTDSLREQNIQHIGVIGTKATIASKAYQQRMMAPNRSITVKATPLLAAMIEEGFTSGDVAESVIKAYLGNDPIRKVDALILGCTHYPLIEEEIRAVIGPECQIIDTPSIVAENVMKHLEHAKLFSPRNRPGTIRIFVSDLTPSFSGLASLFFGDNIDLTEQTLPL